MNYFQAKNQIKIGSISIDTNDLIIKENYLNKSDEGILVSGCGVEGFCVLLNVELNDQLRGQGVVREIVNRVQRARKTAGLKIEDEILIFIKVLEAKKVSIITSENTNINEIKTEMIANKNEPKSIRSEGKVTKKKSEPKTDNHNHIETEINKNEAKVKKTQIESERNKSPQNEPKIKKNEAKLKKSQSEPKLNKIEVKTLKQKEGQLGSLNLINLIQSQRENIQTSLKRPILGFGYRQPHLKGISQFEVEVEEERVLIEICYEDVLINENKLKVFLKFN